MDVDNGVIVRHDRGFYGPYGGAYIPEILRPVMQELEREVNRIQQDPDFWKAYLMELQSYSCRPTPITALPSLSRHLGGARLFLKREDLNHTGAHKLNNVVGQALLTRRLGKKRVIAETGAGQHGVATAMVAARHGLECTIYMGAEDVARQYPNVFWMRQMGAEVIPVEDGTRTLKDAINAALRDWIERFEDTHYLLGTAAGPHPFPSLVAWLQSVIGKESRQQFLAAYQCLPREIHACVGGGSNALGLFQGFLGDPDVKLVGAEAGGTGATAHASRIASGKGRLGIAHGYKSYFLSDREGQMEDTYSIAAGLDYVGISPILAKLADDRRVEFVAVSDTETTEAARLLMGHEGIIPALESAHGLASAFRAARESSPDDCILVNLSGRGDKDIFNMARLFDARDWEAYLRERVVDHVD